jgi:long-chain alkane monooxygenase
MSVKPFHMGWFMEFSPDEWNGPFGGGGSPWNGEFYVEMAQALERACFDLIMAADTLMVSEAYGGSMETYLKHALLVPQHDPAPLAALMASATSHLGIAITLSTMGYPPFLLARLCRTLDHISRGRFAWNIVTTAENHAAQNFGLDKLPDRQLRYDTADEYMDLVCKLFDSWEPDAIVMDREKEIYADYKKVHPINFKGKYFSSRGPLNTAPSPYGRTVFLQAGGSPRGRTFAAKYADCIIAIGAGIEGMKSYRDDVLARAKDAGRNPDDIKVLFCVTPTLGDTEEEAQARHQRMISSPSFIEQSLAFIAGITDIDFSKFDLDKELPHLTTNGEQGSLDMFAQWGSGKKLRQLVIEASGGLLASVELIGTPDQVAERMGEVMREVGGDGYLITSPSMKISRRYISEITDELIPALQRRGLVRTKYTKSTLRDALKEF